MEGGCSGGGGVTGVWVGGVEDDDLDFVNGM